MDILSLLSFGNSIGFFGLCIYAIKLSTVKSKLNRYAFGVCMALGIWNLFYTFFYGNTNKESAWIFYKIATIGMYLFPAFTLKFFLVLTKREKFLNSAFRNIIFYLPSTALIIYLFFSRTTPLADDLVLSKLGLGWIYVNHAGKISFWVTFLFLLLYLWGSLYILYRWGKESKYQIEKKQAHLFLIVDSILLTAGIMTDFILPLFVSEIPPMANIFSGIFIIFFYYIIRELNVFNIDQVASSELIIDTLLEPILVLDNNGVILEANTATEQILGFPMNFLQGKKLSEVLPDNSELEERNYGETIIKHTSKGMIYAIFSKNTVRDQLNGCLGTVIHFKDITEMKQKENKLLVINEKYAEATEKLERIANYDMLTGIPNQRMFLRILSDKVKSSKNVLNDYGLIYMDLNGFKEVNDSFGHDCGDKVLIEVASRLKSLTKASDIVARLGGDEFVMLVNSDKKEEIYQRSENIKAIILEPICFGKLVCQISVAIGISIYSENIHNVEEMLHTADLAMYEHKRYQKGHQDVNINRKV